MKASLVLRLVAVQVSLCGQAQPTIANYTQAVQKRFGDRTDEVLRLYPAAIDEEAEQAAMDLASDGFLGYCTWKWADIHSKTGSKPVYRYYYSRVHWHGAGPNSALTHIAINPNVSKGGAVNWLRAVMDEEYKTGR